MVQRIYAEKRASGITILQKRTLDCLKPSEALGQSRPCCFVSQSPSDDDMVRETEHEQCHPDKNLGHLLCTVLVRVSFAEDDLSAYQHPSIRQCIVTIISR